MVIITTELESLSQRKTSVPPNIVIITIILMSVSWNTNQSHEIVTVFPSLPQRTLPPEIVVTTIMLVSVTKCAITVFWNSYHQQFFFFFFCIPQLYLWGSPFWVNFVCMWPLFNPTIEVVTFRLCGWCMLGVYFVNCIHPSMTWTSGSFGSVRWNACVHRLDLGLYSHPKQLWGNGVRTHVNSKGKIPSTINTVLVHLTKYMISAAWSTIITVLTPREKSLLPSTLCYCVLQSTWSVSPGLPSSLS